MLSFQVGIQADDFPSLTAGNISRLTRSLAARVRKAVIEATPVGEGTAKRSWTPVRKDEGGYSFGNIQPYAKYLEEGGEPGSKPWPSAGPRTVEYGGRIYSSQAPGGITKTADVDALAEKVAAELFDKMFKT